jgi:glycogen(starch) synthase
MTGTNPDGTEQPLKILMTADAVGGVWRYSVDLIEGLVSRGSEVLLATMGPRPSEEQKRHLAPIPNVTLVQSDYALEWMPKPWANVDRAGRWLLDLAQDFAPHLIHLNGYAHAALPWRRPVVVVAHSCVFSWWRAVHGAAPGPEWDEYKRRVLQGLLAATVVITPSAAMARATATEYALPPEKIRIIHNFSNTGTPQPAQKEPFFLAAGRLWDQAKNIALLEHIAPRLHWNMRVSGSECGPEASTANINAVCFLGMLPYAELLEQMARAAVFVHPALYEPFGLSVLEAARRGCCLVLADVPSLRELWNGAAVFLDPRDPDQWLAELNSLTTDLQRRNALAAQAQSHAAKYSALVAVRDYQQVYRSSLSSQRGADNEAAA